MKECSKSISRRLHDSNFINKYFVGDGVDIGGKPDPLTLYKEFFIGITNIKTWDIEDGDAQYMEGIKDNVFDFVHSSHCLEHTNDPFVTINNWVRITKENGYIIFTVPDEDLYEQGIFPSEFNRDHKWTFTIYKEKSWSNKSINIFNLIISLGDVVAVQKIQLLNNTYHYHYPIFDQTLTPVTESGIEIVLRKRSNTKKKGNIVVDKMNLSKEEKIHLNQYKDDLNTLKNYNIQRPPFTNESEI
jgi:SAM-dependent methyltransferase